MYTQESLFPVSGRQSSFETDFQIAQAMRSLCAEPLFSRDAAAGDSRSPQHSMGWMCVCLLAPRLSQSPLLSFLLRPFPQAPFGFGKDGVILS